MTIELKSKNKTLTEAAEAVPKAPNLGEISALDPLYQGQGLRAASKKRRKRQKRAGRKLVFYLTPIVTSWEGLVCLLLLGFFVVSWHQLASLMILCPSWDCVA